MNEKSVYTSMIQRISRPSANDRERQHGRHAIRRVGVGRWYFATQNNAVTFRGVDGERSVLLATYAHGRWSGLAAAERRNAQIWTNLGYRVVELADFNVFARRLGSARCLAKHF